MERFLLKEFAKTPTIQTGVYGSEIQGNATYSEDYTEIQSGTAWEQGIGGATSNALEQPALNDDQGVYKVLCKAIKNGQVSGIPLWINTETYYKGSICLIISNDIPYLYYSLTDNNIGNNPLSDTINWQQFDSSKANIDLNNLSNDGQEKITNLAAPSDRYIDLTLGESGSVYTAPANGWFYLVKQCNGLQEAAFFKRLKNSTATNLGVRGNATDENIAINIPVAKDDVVGCVYSATGSTIQFKFVYANGN